MSDRIICSRGGDTTFAFHWPNGAGGNADLTGFSVSVRAAHPLLKSNVTVSIEDAPTGRIVGLIKWSDEYVNRVPMDFYIGVTQGGITAPTAKLTLEVQ